MSEGQSQSAYEQRLIDLDLLQFEYQCLMGTTETFKVVKSVSGFRPRPLAAETSNPQPGQMEANWYRVALIWRLERKLRVMEWYTDGTSCLSVPSRHMPSGHLRWNKIISGTS